MPTTLALIRNGQNDPAQRVKIWYEIRYNSGQAHQARRRAESDLFGLFDTNTGQFGGNDTEAKITLNLLYERYTTISNRGYLADFNVQIDTSKNYLQTTYTNGNEVDRVFYDTYNTNNITGTDYRDLIFGDSGDDRISSGFGNDFIYGDEGKDSIFGGSGNDTFYVVGTDEAYDIFNGGDGEDTIKGSKDDDTIRVKDFSGDNTVEIIDGDGGDNNIIAGTNETDTIDLSDTIISKINAIATGDGNDDTIIVDQEDLDSGLKKIDGGGGDGDTLKGTDEREVFDFNKIEITGVEKINAGGGNDEFKIKDVSDLTKFKEIDGGDGEDELVGTTGNDVWDFTGNTIKGVEVLNTGGGIDMIFSDQLSGEGDGSLKVSEIKGEGGSLVVRTKTEQSSIDLSGLHLQDIEQVTIFGGNANEIIGSNVDDVIYGGSDVKGGEGNDTIYGREGAADTLQGGAGFDTYYAEEGDTIRDSDGKGVVYKNGKQLTLATRKKGETAYKDDAGNTYILNGTTLLVNDPLVIENFTSGDLGIVLKEELDPDDPDDPDIKDDFEDAEQAVSPIVLDLDGNGIATRGIGEGAFFDYDGNGFAQRTGWITPGDGLLVRDLNQDGRIATGAELFGNNTILENGTLAANGFAALADLDDNSDGKLDAQDAGWSELNIWQDLNSDGITDSGELKTLAEYGIQSISTAYTAIDNTDARGNQHKQQGTFTRTDASTALAEDIWFRTNPASTRQV